MTLNETFNGDKGVDKFSCSHEEKPTLKAIKAAAPKELITFVFFLFHTFF